jgi:hypothetical protein
MIYDDFKKLSKDKKVEDKEREDEDEYEKIIPKKKIKKMK